MTHSKPRFVAFQQWRRFLPVIRAVLTVSTFLSLAPWCPASSGGFLRETTESFNYYQEGHGGRGRRHVLAVDLGGDVTMEFVRIPAGEFQMGSATGRNGRLADEDPHRVK